MTATTGENPQRCSHCDEPVMVRPSGEVITHDWPKFTRQVCPGSGGPAAPPRRPDVSAILDDDDREVFLQGLLLAEAVRRFLARQRTQQVIDMGWMLDADVVSDLVTESRKMQIARGQRIANARNAASIGGGTDD